MDHKQGSIEQGSMSNEDALPHLPFDVETSDHALERLGLRQQTSRYINTAEMVSLAWNICNSWLGVVVVLQYALYNGGPMTLLYGMILIFAMYLCIGGTLAELASVYPTAGGQYHWTAVIAPESISRWLSYCCGAINFFSWISINAGIILLDAQLIMAMAVFYNPDFVPKPYQYFLLYQLWNLIYILVNCYYMRKGCWTFVAAFAFAIVTYIVILATCAARAPSYQSTAFVWTIFDNVTGWSGGVAFLTAAVAPNYMYTGIDGAIHLAEEARDATKAVPRAIFCTILTGFVTAWTFCIALLYSGQNYTKILGSSTGFPVYELMAEACRSRAAATIFMVFFLIIAIFTELGSVVTASRLTWALARDRALVFSDHLSRIDSRFEAPVYATWANGVVLFIIGFIYLGSPTIFESFVATGIILNILSFSFPALLIMARRRSEHYLPKDRPFKIPGVLGWVANFFAFVWPIIGAVFYCWPATFPVTSANMNYASAIIGCMALFVAFNWFVAARKNYRPPKLGKL